MKKLSLMLVFVMLFATLFAFSVFADGFVRGEENTVITSDDIAVDADGNKMYEITAGKTAHGKPSDVLDGVGTAYWGGPTGTNLKITFENEWEITDAKAYLLSNWAHIEFIFYAADDTKLGSANFYGISANTGTLWGGDTMQGTASDLNAAIKNLTYGDGDKAVKYIIINNYGDKWGYLPGVAELVLTGRERIPTQGCEKHEFETIVIEEATCTEAGSSANVCTLCGAQEAVVTIPALGHKIDPDNYTIKTPATCTHGAVIEFVCANGCGETIERDMDIQDVTDYGDPYSVVIEGSGGHTNGTMFDNDWSKFQMASGGWFVSAQINLDMPYYISSVSLWIGYGDNGYTSKSTMVFSYQKPGETEWIEVGSRLVPVVETPSWTAYKQVFELEEAVYASAIKIRVKDLDDYSGVVYEAEVAGSMFADTIATNHNWVAGEVVAPTCVNVGYTHFACADCEETKKDAFVLETKVHNYTVKDEEASVDATCLEAGSLVMVCETCTKTQTTPVEALGHDMQPATCVTPSTCSRCGLTEGEVGGHVATEEDYEGYVYEGATCTTEGYVTDLCGICGEEFTTILEIDPEAHIPDWENAEFVGATCQEDGYDKYTCVNCEVEITVVYEASTDFCQLETVEFVAATCQTAGYELCACTVCGAETRYDFEANEFAHVYDDAIGDGVVVYTCTLCGASYEEELDPALPYGDTAIEIVAGEEGFVESVYYTLTAGNYVLTFDVNDNVYLSIGYETNMLETSPYTIEVAEGEYVTVSFMTPDFAAGTVNVNLASADNAMLNGTYVTPDGSATFVFADGALTITDTNPMMASGFAGEYTYNYNSVTGEVANSANLPMIVSNGTIVVFGRMPLTVYVPPMDLVVGDNNVTVTNTNYFFNGIKVVFTATEAGTYVITASDTGIVLVENEYGSEMVELPYEIELAEGQAFEFIVTSSANPMMGTNDEVVITVAEKAAEHVHTEVEIAPVPSYKDANKVVVPGMTSGVKCAECDEIIVAPVAVSSKFFVQGNRLSLSDYVNVDYGLSIPAGYTNVYVVYVSDASNGEPVVVEYDGSGISTYRGIKMQNLGDNIHATVYATTADGLTAVYVQEEYSVRTYCVNQLAKASNGAALKTMISDLLEAGAAAQKYSGYKADQLVNKGADIESLLTPSGNKTISGKDVSAYNVIDSSTYSLVDFMGRNLSVGNAMAVQFLLKISPDALDRVSIEVVVDRSANKLENLVYTFSVAEENLEAQGNNQYLVKVPDLRVIEYGSTITATISLDGQETGRQAVYSVNSYLERNYNKASVAASMQDFLLAMYNYGASAEAYKNA